MSEPEDDPIEVKEDIQAAALFVNDDELRRRVNPKMGRDRFRATVKVAELEGFPKKNALWGGRYWPSVRAWFDGVNGLRNFEPHGIDGVENFDAPPRRTGRRRK